MDWINKTTAEFTAVDFESSEKLIGHVYFATGNTHVTWDRSCDIGLQTEVISEVVSRLQKAKFPCVTL